MTAECVRAFTDLRANVKREAGEQFETTAERFRELNGSKYGQLVREVRPRKRRKG